MNGQNQHHHRSGGSQDPRDEALIPAELGPIASRLDALAAADRSSPDRGFESRLFAASAPSLAGQSQQDERSGSPIPFPAVRALRVWRIAALVVLGAGAAFLNAGWFMGRSNTPTPSQRPLASNPTGADVPEKEPAAVLAKNVRADLEMVLSSAESVWDDVSDDAAGESDGFWGDDGWDFGEGAL